MTTSFHLIDWLIFCMPIILVFVIVAYTQRYMRSVADFMSGGRKAGRYLLAVSRAEMNAGAVVFVATFEMISQSGFVLTWWNWASGPIALIVAISGFVFYRFRETRALTLAQFFELRYSKSFRLFCGFMAFFAGIMNFGIMPLVSSRFFVYFLGFPVTLHFGGFDIPTFIPVMGILMALTVYMALAGGMVTLITTNCIEGILSQVFYLIIIVGLLSVFSWSEISEVLSNHPAGESLLNPFDSNKVKDFNLWYVIMALFINIYGTMAWQNQGAYNSAGISAHETRMGNLLGRIREMGKGAVVVLLAVCGITFLSHPDFAAQAAHVREVIQHMPDSRTQGQMSIPIALAFSLPVAAKGALCAVLLLGMFGGDSNHMHSWGSIFVQDLLVPLRKKPFTAKQQILILRLAIGGVAIFIFLFGCFFKLADYINMWWVVTTSIYVGGAGAAIIGGLYWKKGTTVGAWCAMISGSILSVGGVLVQQIYGSRFPLNGMQVSFFAMLVAVAVYVIASLLTHKEDYNMDRMLHRGAYAKNDPSKHDQIENRKLSWGKLIGFDEHFSKSDKWIAGGLFGWSMLWCLVMIIGTIWNAISPWPMHVWSSFWHVVAIGLPIVIAFVVGIWFTWGGIVDMKSFFDRLRNEKINELDNGTVIGHQNLDDKE